MKRRKTNSLILVLMLTMAMHGLSASASSQQLNQDAKGSPNTITYHNGPLLTGTPGVYFIWYGCWDETCRSDNTAIQTILTDFVSNVGGSPYFQINAMYPNGSGSGPSGALLYGGSDFDNYSHGMELTATDIADIVRDQIESNGLPQDPSGIYVVLASDDVSSTATGFCVPSALTPHGVGEALGSQFSYAFIGNPARCPSVAAPQFFSRKTQLPTPNGNLAGDAMASNLAQVLSGVITNPTGGGWFDRNGLENAQKCVGQFGNTYATTTGARANLRLGGRDYLIQENWVNDRKGHCAMNSSL